MHGLQRSIKGHQSPLSGGAGATGSQGWWASGIPRDAEDAGRGHNGDAEVLRHAAPSQRSPLLEL